MIINYQKAVMPRSNEITALINGISSPFCAKCACLQLFLLMGNQSLNFQVKL